MKSTVRTSLTAVALAVCSLMTAVLTLQAAPPKGWFMAGTKPTSYDSGLDTLAVMNGQPSAFMKSNQASIDGFGTLMQNFSATQYLGQRVRFSALVKSDSVSDWAGLWMRIDGNATDPTQRTLAFDNMMDRGIKGTTGWQSYDVVLDVPQNATGIFFGILLSGTGEVWLSGVKFEVVGSTVPTTGHQFGPSATGPTNLGFEK